MANGIRRRRARKIFIVTASAAMLVLLLSFFFVDRFVEPILKDRIHTLIVKGSDSLYTYKLGSLNSSFFLGDIEVKNLQINIDSSRYNYLRARNRLPALTMFLDLQEGSISGINVFALLFSKKIRIHELKSKKANIRLIRHIQVGEAQPELDEPLWKSIQPSIRSLQVDRILLDGVKLLYKNADTSESVKLQFEECNALFEDIRVDSVAAFDSTRIGFTKNITLRFHNLEFRTADSSYNMQAEWVHYSSRDKLLSVDSFKLRPTLEREEFYKTNPIQQTLYNVDFHKVRFVNMRLERFVNNNVIAADSAVFQRPSVSIYLDRTMRPLFMSKIGKYPHQKLLSAAAVIDVSYLYVENANMEYTEKNAKTGMQGAIAFNDFSLLAKNVTNDRRMIPARPVCEVEAKGKFLKQSDFALHFRFFLDSVNGSYESWGYIQDIKTEQLKPLAASFANVELNGFNISKLDFRIRGRDHDAQGSVNLMYDGLSVVMKKMDEETGQITVKKFLTKILNKFVMHPSNPGPDGVVRVSHEARALRLSTQSFFGLLWKTIFDGMQDVIMKAGRLG